MAVFTWGTIKDWNGDDLNDTLNGLSREWEKAKDVNDSINSIDVESGWEGEGSRAASEALGRLEDASAHCWNSIVNLLTATTAAQDGVNEVKVMVEEIRSMADTNHLIISDDGSVQVNIDKIVGVAEQKGLASSGAGPSVPYGLPHASSAIKGVIVNGLQAKVKECVEMIERACRKAAEVDATYAKALSRELEGSARDLKVLEGREVRLRLPDGTSTEDVARWWHSLTDKQREEMRDKAIESIRARLASDYERLGNMDGIDANTRSVINKARVERDLESLQRRGLKEGDKEFDELLGIKEVMDERPDVGLYLYERPRLEDGHADTHAAYAIGDVDRAAHVTTFVPGMTTTVADSMDNVDRMQDLKGRAEAEGQGDVAAIAWLGYDAPPFPGPENMSVTRTEAAELGGNSLAKHLEGVEDSRNASGQPVHQSVLGHSYGSTTSSYGVSQVRPGVVDDYAVFGSPGVKDTAQAMHVPEGHSYAMVYRREQGDSGDVINILNEGKDAISDSTGALGKNPMDADSGFKTMETGRSHAQDPFNAHKNYLREGSRPQGNLARVVAGTAG